MELSNLRLLAEELQVHRLPELQMLLNDQTQQLMELQIQHQQVRQRKTHLVSVSEQIASMSRFWSICPGHGVCGSPDVRRRHGGDAAWSVFRPDPAATRPERGGCDAAQPKPERHLVQHTGGQTSPDLSDFKTEETQVEQDQCQLISEL